MYFDISFHIFQKTYLRFYQNQTHLYTHRSLIHTYINMPQSHINMQTVSQHESSYTSYHIILRVLYYRQSPQSIRSMCLSSLTRFHRYEQCFKITFEKWHFKVSLFPSVVGQGMGERNQALAWFYKDINDTRTFDKSINLSSSLIGKQFIDAHPLAVSSGIDTCLHLIGWRSSASLWLADDELEYSVKNVEWHA